MVGFPTRPHPSTPTFDLLILVGCYLALLRPPAPLPEVRRSERLSWLILRIALFGAVLLQIVLGTVNGVTDASHSRSFQISISDITANIDGASANLVQREVLQSPQWIRQMAHFAQVRHLSLFATSAAATYRKGGLFPAFSVPSTEVLIPANGAKLSGVAVLDADVMDDQEPITKVTFHLTGRSQLDELIGTARLTLAGWATYWDTTTIANGTYMLRSEAYIGSGRHSYSRAITVTVRN